MTRNEPLVVVANRLPLTWADGQGWSPSAGGLVTALEEVFVGSEGHWVGWSGGDEPAPDEWNGIRLHSVALTPDDVAAYYDGFSNSCLWPLMHDGLRPARMDWDWWRTYEVVNERFALRVADVAPDGATVWIHDYHLLLLPALLRALRPDVRIGYFHHIPFPPPVIFQRLPWRDQLVEGLLGADLLGFQTVVDADHFRAQAAASGAVVAGADLIGADGRRSTVAHFPATIDVRSFEDVARTEATLDRARELQEAFGADRRVLLGVDRLDYTKAITARLEAFGLLLDRRPELAETVTFVQVAVPTREDVAEYQAECAEVQRLVGEINGRHGRMGTSVVHFRHGGLDREELVALYRVADVMVVTPWRDGMNLVAKEYVAARIDEQGVLVLSEFAGAARELTEAVIVNPFDVVGIVDGYLEALEMPVAMQRLRMHRLRSTVRAWDCGRWARSFLAALGRAEALAARGTAA